jgi:hypothetical protein
MKVAGIAMMGGALKTSGATAGTSSFVVAAVDVTASTAGDVSLGSDGNDSSDEFDMNFAALNPNRVPHSSAAHLPLKCNTEDSSIP